MTSGAGFGRWRIWVIWPGRSSMPLANSAGSRAVRAGYSGESNNAVTFRGFVDIREKERVC